MERALFDSSAAFRDVHADDICIHCSDGRFVEQTEEFLRRGLKLSGYDLLVVPGGPACLAGDPAAWRDGEVASESIRFLQRAHNLRRAILIAHVDCGFYQGKLGVSGDALEPRELEDLGKAAARIRSAAPSVAVEAYIARVADGRVRFAAVDV